MKFLAAFGAPSVNRSASMSPRSVVMMARVMGDLLLVEWGQGRTGRDRAPPGGQGVATVTLVIGMGSMAALLGSPEFGRAAIASTASMPDVTWPTIWYPYWAELRAEATESSRTMKNCEPTEFGAGVRAIATVPRL